MEVNDPDDESKGPHKLDGSDESNQPDESDGRDEPKIDPGAFLGFDAKLLPSVTLALKDLARVGPIDPAALRAAQLPPLLPPDAGAKVSEALANLQPLNAASFGEAAASLKGWKGLKLDPPPTFRVEADELFEAIQSLNLSSTTFDRGVILNVPPFPLSDVSDQLDESAEEAVALADVNEFAEWVDALFWTRRLKAMSPQQQ
jgi:hypothetical protein